MAKSTERGRAIDELMPVGLVDKVAKVADPESYTWSDDDADEVRQRAKKIIKLVKANDDSPFDRDTDAGAAKIVKREAKAGLAPSAIVKKYGFSLSFVKEVLDDLQPV